MTDTPAAPYQRPEDYWCNDDAQVATIEAALDFYEAHRSDSAENEGYPGIAHDLETMRYALEYIASLPDSYPASAIVARAKDALKKAAPQVARLPDVDDVARVERPTAAPCGGTQTAPAESAAFLAAQRDLPSADRDAIQRLADAPDSSAPCVSVPMEPPVAADVEAAFEVWWQKWRTTNGYDNNQRMRETARAVYAELSVPLAVAPVSSSPKTANENLLLDDRFTGKFIEEYVEGYTFEGDNGYHQPTEAEKILLLDCCVGLVSELVYPNGEFSEFCKKVLATTERGAERNGE